MKVFKKRKGETKVSPFLWAVLTAKVSQGCNFYKPVF